MEWTPATLWLIVALLLGLAELASGGMVLLALGMAALLTALVAYLGASLAWQLLSLGIFAGILVPLAAKFLKPWFSPRGVAYGTTGTGVERGRVYRTERRDFDGAIGIKINGDFYRLRLERGAERPPGNETPAEATLSEGTEVIFHTFDGTTAVVSLPPNKES